MMNWLTKRSAIQLLLIQLVPLVFATLSYPFIRGSSHELWVILLFSGGLGSLLTYLLICYSLVSRIIQWKHSPSYFIGLFSLVNAGLIIFVLVKVWVTFDLLIRGWIYLILIAEFGRALIFALALQKAEGSRINPRRTLELTWVVAYPVFGLWELVRRISQIGEPTHAAKQED